MKIAILGSSGMLGKAVIEAATKIGLEIAPNLDSRVDLIVNCAGAIPIKNYPIREVIDANSILPINMSSICQTENTKFLHVSTDCVFSGSRQSAYSYHANDVPDAVDLYGRSKALGELCTIYEAMVIRTSFIGYDHGLLNWLLQQKGEIEGWERVYWTGSSVYEVAKRLLEIEFKPGIYHLSSPKVLSKCSVLEELRDLFNVPVDIKPIGVPVINRALYPDYELRPIDSNEVQRELKEHYS